MITPTVSELKQQVQAIEDSFNQVLVTEPDTQFSAAAHLLDRIEQLATDIEQLMKKCLIPNSKGPRSESQSATEISTVTTVRNEFIKLWQLEGTLHRVQRELFTFVSKPYQADDPAHSTVKIDLALSLKQPLPGDEANRLSQRLGLEVPYDWSNAQMNLNVLVIKILKQYRFNDVLTMSKYLGSEQLQSVAAKIYSEDIPSRLIQILKSIGRAEKRLRARELGRANARLSGLKSTPELDAIVEKFMDGKISLEQAFIKQGIRRAFKFEIIVSMPSGKQPDDYIEGFEKSCSDAFLGLGIPRQIGMRFERLALTYSEAVSSALKDISIVIPNPRILKVSPFPAD